MKNLYHFFKLILMFLHISISSCSASEYMKSSDAKREFYDFYPELKNKSHNFHAYAEATDSRETIRYYKIEVSKKDAEIFLKKAGFVNVNLLPVRSVTTIGGDGAEKKRRGEKISCNSSFIELIGGKKSYPKWWDVEFSDQTMCYLIPPEDEHRVSQAIFDRQQNILYIHKYRAW